MFLPSLNRICPPHMTSCGENSSFEGMIRRSHTIGGENEPSEVDPFLKNSFYREQFLSDGSFSDHDPVTQSQSFQYFIFRDGFMARRDPEVSISLEFPSRGTGCMTFDSFSKFEANRGKFPHPLSLPSLQEEIAPVNLTDAEAFWVLQ